MEPIILIIALIALIALAMFLGYQLGRDHERFDYNKAGLTPVQLTEMANQLIRSSIVTKDLNQSTSFKIEANVYRMWAKKLNHAKKIKL